MGENVNGSAVMMDMEKEKDECFLRKLDAFMTSKFGEEWLNFIPPPEIPEKIKQVINIYRQPNIFQLRNGLEFCSVPDGYYKDCYITQKNSPVDFYVQTQQMIQTVGVRINQQIDELVQEGRLILFKKPKEGDICLAPSDDDDDDSKIKMLFRGEILKIRRGYLKIFFMDFGGVARVFPTSIYQMPEELKKLPKLAVRAQWAMTLCDEVAGDEKKMEFDLLGSVEGHYDVYFNEKISEGEYLVDFGKYKSSEYAEFIIHDEIKKYDDLYFIDDPAMSQQDAESVFTIVEDRQLKEIRRPPPPIEIFASSSVSSVKENIKPMKKMDNNVLPIHVNAQVIMPEALVNKKMDKKAMPIQVKEPEALVNKKMERNAMQIQAKTSEMPEALRINKMDKKSMPVQERVQEVKEIAREVMDVEAKAKRSVKNAVSTPAVPAEPELKIREKARKPNEPLVWNSSNVVFTNNIKEDSKVRITFAWSPLKLMIISVKDEGIIESGVQAVITEYINGNPLKLDRLPVRGEYLLGEYMGDYYRGFVIKVCPGKEKVKLEFVDFGDHTTIKLDKVFIPSAEIMKFPIYGQIFGLHQIDDIPEGYIMSEHISKLFDLDLTIKHFANDKVTLGTDNFLMNDLIAADINDYQSPDRKTIKKN